MSDQPWWIDIDGIVCQADGVVDDRLMHEIMLGDDVLADHPTSQTDVELIWKVVVVRILAFGEYGVLDVAQDVHRLDVVDPVSPHSAACSPIATRIVGLTTGQATGDHFRTGVVPFRPYNHAVPGILLQSTYHQFVAFPIDLSSQRLERRSLLVLALPVLHSLETEVVRNHVSGCPARFVGFGADHWQHPARWIAGYDVRVDIEVPEVGLASKGLAVPIS